MRILDDTDLGNFLTSLNSKYTLPSRGYLETNVLEPMYYETKQVVKNLLNKCKNIGLTADAWSSLNHKSYITITAHFIDDAGDIKRCVLDTGEIVVRHTSENLLMHIVKVLDKYNLKERNPNLNTCISSMYTDPDGDDIDHLSDTQSQESQSQQTESQVTQSQQENKSQDSQSQEAAANILGGDLSQSSLASQYTPPPLAGQSRTQFDFDETQIEPSTLSPEQIIQLRRTHPEMFPEDSEIPIVPQGVCFTTDNANDITKALKKLGKFRWFGCAGHNMNLVIQAGFKKVEDAGKLVKKCKRVIEHVNHSIPAGYLLQEIQQDLEIPITKLIQENQTRWWSITMMMESLIKNKPAINAALLQNNRNDLMITQDQFENMEAICSFLKEFRDIGTQLGQDDDVTITRVLPVWDYLGTL